MCEKKDIDWGTFWLVIIIVVVTTIGIRDSNLIKKQDCTPIEQTK